MKLPDHLHGFALKLALKIAPDGKGERLTGHHEVFADSFRSFRRKLKIPFQTISESIPDLSGVYNDIAIKLRQDGKLDDAISQIRKANHGHGYVLAVLAWIVIDKDRAKLYWDHVRELGFIFLDGYEVPSTIQFIRTEEARLIEIANSSSFTRVTTPTDSVLIAREITKIHNSLIISQGEATRYLPNAYSEVAQDTLLAQLHDFILRHRHRAPFSNLISEMGRWYRIGHWSDEKAHASRFAMQPVVRMALETAGSFSNPQTLELALQYAHSCKLMHLDHQQQWIMTEVEKLPDLPQEKQARRILLQYTDGLLNAQAMEGKPVPEELLERMKVEEPIVQACVWRCAACLSLPRQPSDQTDAISLSPQPSEQTTFFVEMARKAFKLAASTNQSSMSDEDKIIPLYLDTIELISEVETEQKVSGRHIERLNEVILKIRRADNKAFTFILGLLDLKIRLTIGMEAGFYEPILYDTYQEITGNTEALLAIEGLSQNAVKDFCFFDIKAVQSRIDKW